MKRALVRSMSAIVLMWATSVVAQPNITGSYAFTSTAQCLIAPGFSSTPTNPTPFVALPNSGFCTGPDLPDPGCVDGRPRNIGPTGKNFSHSWAAEGIKTFNGDGTGTVSGSELGLTVPPTPGPASEYPHFPPAAITGTYSYNFTYVVNGDGSWTADVVPGTFTSSHIRGPRAGQTATIDNFPTLTGLIGQGGTMLSAATADPTGQTMTVETVRFSNGDVWPRICHRSSILFKLGP